MECGRDEEADQAENTLNAKCVGNIILRQYHILLCRNKVKHRIAHCAAESYLHPPYAPTLHTKAS